MDGNADGEDGSCLGSKGSRGQSSPGCLVVPELIGCYLHFNNKEADSERLSNLSQNTQYIAATI